MDKYHWQSRETMRITSSAQLSWCRYTGMHCCPGGSLVRASKVDESDSRVTSWRIRSCCTAVQPLKAHDILVS